MYASGLRLWKGESDPGHIYPGVVLFSVVSPHCTNYKGGKKSKHLISKK